MELASLQEKLKEEGWNLSNSGIELLSENGKITDIKTLIKKAVDVDLKTISKGVLPEDINKTKYDQIPGNIVLQIQKIKNLSSPKSSELFSDNKSILKLNLTDGIQNVQAVQMDPIPNINMNTFPGSKIHINSECVEISHCFLLLFSSNTQFLGGKVMNLVEKWELNKRLAKHTRQWVEGGPPPWIGFGEKMTKQIISRDKNFKSLDLGKNKDSLEISEFEAQRNDAILEATKIGCTKVFGGGNNKLLDYNVQQIVDAGFTIEDAEYALKISKNNLDKALRNLKNKYNKGNKDENSKSNSKSGSEEKKGKGRNKHRDEDSAPSSKPSGKVSLFDFLEDKLPFSEPPVETKPPPQEKRNGNAIKAIKKPLRVKFACDEKRSTDKLETKTQKKSYESSSKTYSKFEFSDKWNHSDKKPQFGKFEGKKSYDASFSSKPDKSFGNFKGKYEIKNGDYSNSKIDFFKSKSNDKRTQSNLSSSAIKSHNRSNDVNDNKKTMSFSQTNEKPPRFQKFQNQQNDNQCIQNWNDHTYNRIPPQSEYQLQNSIANLTLQQNVANFQNQNSQDGYGDVLAGVTATNTKPNNLFFQNVVIPSSQSNDNRLIGNQNSQPPPLQSHLNTYGNRNIGGFIHQEVKNSNFSNIPNLQDVAFKSNGPLLHGYNDFQSVFGNARAPSNNYANAPYLAGPNGMPHQSHKQWIWNKGDKCMARYWEDQMYYNAIVTAVSENTCVVRFTDYGNYEEVLQDHCIPITEES